MTWIMRLPDGAEASSDDFTLGDLEQVEDEGGQPWSVANCYRSAKVARAFLRVAYRRGGLDPTDVDALTMKRLKRVFVFQEDEPVDTDGEETDDSPLDQTTSPVSSPGASSAAAGPRRKPAANG